MSKTIPSARQTDLAGRTWSLVESRPLQAFRIFKLRQDTRRSPRTGREHPFIVIDSTDWVNIVPVTPEGKLVMIRQFRHGIADLAWEIPGGMIDPEDRNPRQAALRELLEETGYRPTDCRFVGCVHPNPAIQNNRCHTFLAENVTLCQEQKLDCTEEIEVREIPWAEVRLMIDRGDISHGLVLNALFWYERHLAGKPIPPELETRSL